MSKALYKKKEINIFLPCHEHGTGKKLWGHHDELMNLQIPSNSAFNGFSYLFPALYGLFCPQ